MLLLELSVSVVIWKHGICTFFFLRMCGVFLPCVGVHVLRVCRQASGPGCILRPHDDSAR